MQNLAQLRKRRHLIRLSMADFCWDCVAKINFRSHLRRQAGTWNGTLV